MSNKNNKKLNYKSPSHQFFVALIVLALIGFVSMGYFYQRPVKKQKVLAQAVVQDNPLPLFKGNFPMAEISARGVYAVDINSGETLYSKNSNEPLLPASTTKIATAVVAMKVFNGQDILTVSGVQNITGQKMGLFNGEKITAESLIYGILIHSANDAAMVIANNYSGGYKEFINEMNQLASDWGLNKTHFTNPVGFDEYLHFSTAEDLVKLSYQAMNDPHFAEIVSLQGASVASSDGYFVHNLKNTNLLLGEIPGVVGVKTGHTISSGESLVTQINNDDKKILIALVGSVDRFGETKLLIDWILGNYSWENTATGFSGSRQ